VPTRRAKQMKAVYASVSDITALGISLPAQQQQAAEILLETASAKLRLEAVKYGSDIDDLIADEKNGEDYGLTVKNIVVQAVVRALDAISDTAPAVTQASQSALGYSASMTYLNAGQSLYFLRNELKELGLFCQVYGALEVYGSADDKGN